MKRRVGMLLAASVVMVIAGDGAQRVPVKVPFEQTLDYQWLRKPVLADRVLDDMEALDHWTLRGKGEMALATDPAKQGAHSLRLSVMTRTPEDPTPPGSRNYGYVQITRAFDHEDWTGFNRLSVWVWPDLPGWYTINLRMTLLNEGAEKSPDPVDHNGENAILIPRNHAWNHVVWEIPGIPRDKVVGVAFSVRRQGNEPEASNHISFYLDHLTLERVQEDHYEGWDVAPGQIAYSQSGYRTDSTKTAIASGSGARTFSLVRTETGEAVLTEPVEKRHTSLGDFEVMDFTEVKTPGSYRIRAGPLSTPSQQYVFGSVITCCWSCAPPYGTTRVMLPFGSLMSQVLQWTQLGALVRKFTGSRPSLPPIRQRRPGRSRAGRTRRKTSCSDVFCRDGRYRQP